jgi:hypothetical protein
VRVLIPLPAWLALSLLFALTVQPVPAAVADRPPVAVVDRALAAAADRAPAAAIYPAECTEPAHGVDPFGFREGDYSAWGIVDADYPYTGRVGCFPVGNGVIFATLGVDPNFNALTSLTGPGYQTRDDAGGVQYWQAGNWPPMPVKLVRVTPPGAQGEQYAFAPVEWQTQSIQQLRGAAMVRTIQHNEKLTLCCLTYAIPESCVLQREYVLLGAQPGETYGLSIDRTLAVYDELGEQMQGENRLVVFSDAPRYQDDRQGLTVIQGVASAFSGGAALSFSVGYHAFKAAEIYVPDEQGGLGLGDAFLEHFSYLVGDEVSPQRCYDYWREWSSHNLRFDTGDARLDDLMLQVPVIIETQRDAQSGGYSPMVNYHGYWVRDSLGPIYVNLLNGRFEEVMRMLRYHRKACWKLGNCSMLVPLDLDVSDVHEPGSTAVPGRDQSSVARAALPAGKDGGHGGPPHRTAVRPTSEDTGRDARAPRNSWDDIPVEHAEVPSLIVLQHYWLWKCMRAAGQGDAADAFIAEAWPFITHNLLAMQFDPTYGVRFHGDETYTNGALYSTFDSGEPGQIGYPNGYIPTDFFSFDNTMLHRGAATAVHEMARALGDSEVHKQAEELGAQLDPILERYFDPTQGVYAPAISPVTGQLFPTPFSNISLSPWSLGVPCKGLKLGQQYWYASEVFQFNWYFVPIVPASSASNETHGSLYRYATLLDNWPCTPWSPSHTGHGLASWLNAARNNRDRRNLSRLAEMVVDLATPDSAWCEVYNGDCEPQSIYGRVNRIRPWESGINYAMLAVYLADRGQLRLTPGSPKVVQRTLRSLSGRPDDYNSYQPRRQRKQLTWNELQTLQVPLTAQALVLTRDGRYKDVFRLDSRLCKLAPEQIAVWDIGLPVTPQNLRRSLMKTEQLALHKGRRTVLTPYLYLDRGVKLSDRRTFKTSAFWDALEPVLKKYQAAGGTVLDESSLKPGLADDEAVALRVLIVLYPHTFCWDMDTQTIANFHKEIAKWIGWYDKIAGDKLKLQLDFLQIGRRLPPRACGPQGGNVYWMGCSDVEADLLARGIPRDHYDSVCCFWAWDREAPSLPGGSKAAQAYGGAAEGPGGDVALLGEAGRTSYYGAAVLKSHFVTTGRVALHEYLHNLDAMFSTAGLDGAFYSSDDMEQHMPEMLAERPGLFQQFGYDDAAMLDLADKSSRGEAGFPWRTQLVYYQWMLERTPRSDFAQLLKRFGERVKVAPRGVLYDSFTLPEGDAPYQIKFDGGRGFQPPIVRRQNAAATTDGGGTPPVPRGEAGAESRPTEDAMADTAVRPTGLEPITIEDVDTDGYAHWRSEALGGTLGEPYAQPVRFYKEAEIVAPDLQQVVLGQGTPELRVELRDSVSKQPLPGATVQADVAGQSVALTDAGSGAYSAPLPAGLEADLDVKYAASSPGYVVSDNLCALSVKPAWTAIVQFRYSDVDKPPSEAPFNPGIAISLQGPPGQYGGALSYHQELSTVEQLLAADGLMTQAADYSAEVALTPGAETYIELDPHVWASLHYASGALRVDYAAPSGSAASFTQHLSAQLGLPAVVNGIDTARMPAYIPRARRFRPVLDGELGEWPAEPSLRLTQQNGHADGPGFASADDGATDLWLAYDDANLYVAGRVKDDMLKSGDMWSSDRLNLVFDALLDTTRETYPHGAVGQAGWAKDDWWVLLCPFVNSVEGQSAPLTERLGGEIPSGGKTGYYGEVAGAQAQVAQEQGGYRFEWALPLSSLPYLTPKPGGFCGFTFFLSDHDAALNELMYVTNWWGPGGIEWRYWDCGLLYFEP